MEIILPGYDELFENKLYTRFENLSRKIYLDREIIILEPEDLTFLLFINTFKQPTVEQIVNRVKTGAQKAYKAVNSIVTNPEDKLDSLEVRIAMLGSKFLNKVLDEDKITIDKIIKYVNQLDLKSRQEGKEYLNVNYGFMPPLTLTSYAAAKGKDEVIDTNWYFNKLLTDFVRSAGYGIRWNMHLSLEQDLLPDKDYIITGLRSKELDPRIIKIAGDFYLEDNLQVIDALYSGLNKDNVGYLEDLSDKHLSFYAGKVVEKLREELFSITRGN